MTTSPAQIDLADYLAEQIGHAAEIVGTETLRDDSGNEYTGYIPHLRRAIKVANIPGEELPMEAAGSTCVEEVYGENRVCVSIDYSVRRLSVGPTYSVYLLAEEFDDRPRRAEWVRAIGEANK